VVCAGDGGLEGNGWVTTPRYLANLEAGQRLDLVCRYLTEELGKVHWTGTWMTL
jgi:hypothetical protein